MAKSKAPKTPAAASLLVELLAEELPPKSLSLLSRFFGDEVGNRLSRYQLKLRVPDWRVFATPRRLAVLVPDVLAVAEDRSTEVPGPSIKAPPEAVAGFARKNGVDVAALEQRDTPKGMVYFAHTTLKGASLNSVLPNVVSEVLQKLPIPKVMRWSNGDKQFVRPVHGLVMMHGRHVVPGAVLDVLASNTTSGHRFMGAASIRLANADEYEARLLKDGRVIADFAARKSEIDKQLQAEARRQKARLGEYQDLLEEVTALVEFPAVYAGEFDASFLEVPQECLILTMRKNQKYFPLFAPDGKLLQKFLIVSNMRVDHPRPIVGGNERVVRPRLEDARFFFKQDRKIRLEARVPQLAKVVFHSKLGSQLERVQRIKLLAGEIARALRADVMQTERAAELSKADLLTAMVGEFPELQGVMGRYYALHDGEPREVADAIEAHYHPRFAGDAVPHGSVACAVALAEKIDTLIGLFAVGAVPTGDKDPFGLRRAALGVIRILVETPLAVQFEKDLLEPACVGFVTQALIGGKTESYQESTANVRMFMLERLRSYCRDKGYSAEEVEAVISPIGARLDHALPKLEAVRSFCSMPEAENLAAANKRIKNILKQANFSSTVLMPNPNIPEEAAEKVLRSALTQT